MKRTRGRSYRSGGGSGGGGGGGGAPRQYNGNVPPNRNHVFDSSGPDLRIRGTAQQLFEKYLQLGRDATGVGDRVMAESYFQYAEHYFRILNAINQATQGQHQQSQPHQQGQQYQPNQQGQAPAPQANHQGNGNHYNGQRRQPGEGYEADGQGEQGYDEPSDGREIPIAAGPEN